MNIKNWAFRDIAIAIMIVFALTVVAYPLIFSTDSRPKAVVPAQIK